MNKIYNETNEIGTHKVIEKPNGIKIKLLQEPSESYKAKMKKRADEEKIKQAEQDIINQREKLIKDKMRELAIQELEKEGKI